MKDRLELAALFEEGNSMLQDWRSEDFNGKALACAGKLIAGVDAAIYYLYQPENQTLMIKEAFGFERDITGLFPMQIGEGLCGQVFASGEGRLINDLRQIEGLTGEMTSLMDIIHLDEGSNTASPTSMIAVPVLVEEQKRGVLLLISFSLRLGFDTADYQVGLFMANVLGMHLQSQDGQKRLSQYRRDVKRLQDIILLDDDGCRKSRLTERSLLDLFLRGKGFSDILNGAGQVFPYPLALYNLFLEKISGDDSAVAKELPENILNLQVMQDLIYWKAPQFIQLEEDVLHLFPVVCDETLRGFIACWTPNQHLSDEEIDLLEIICRICACVWVKLAAVNEANQHLKSELLTGILSGKQNDELLNKSRSFGFYNENMFFVILLTCPNVDNHISYSAKREGVALTNYLTALLNNNALSSIIVPERNDICIIASYKDRQRKNNRYDNIVREVMYKIYENNPELQISGGRIYSGIFNIRKTYWEANQCMVIINKYFIHRKVVNYGDVGVLRLLLTQKKEDVEAYLEDILGPIIEYDRKKNAELLTTLFYYSRFNQSSSYVAHKLNIHANTLYQRVKKAEELMGYDFENPMDWLDVQTASIMYGLIYTDLITKL